jgi:hypothetical protein
VGQTVAGGKDPDLHQGRHRYLALDLDPAPGRGRDLSLDPDLSLDQGPELSLDQRRDPDQELGVAPGDHAQSSEPHA